MTSCLCCAPRLTQLRIVHRVATSRPSVDGHQASCRPTGSMSGEARRMCIEGVRPFYERGRRVGRSRNIGARPEQAPDARVSAVVGATAAASPAVRLWPRRRRRCPGWCTDRRARTRPCCCVPRPGFGTSVCAAVPRTCTSACSAAGRIRAMFFLAAVPNGLVESWSTIATTTTSATHHPAGLSWSHVQRRK